MKQFPRVSPWTMRLAAFMLTVPFALALNSNQVTVTTTVYQDGSGMREIAAQAQEYFSDALPRWTRDVEAGGLWQRHWRSSSKAQSNLTVKRDFVTSNMNRVGGEDTLAIVGIFQEPLDIYTTYTWSEQVKLEYHYESNPDEARAGDHTIQYVVQMPGPITGATQQPATSGSQEISQSGRRVTFTFDASEPEHSVTVQSRRVRWEYLAIAAWVVLFIVGSIIRFVVRRRRTRPRRI